MKTRLFIILSLVFFRSIPVRAETGKLEPEALREYLANQYVAEFVQEFNSFSIEQAQEFYGYFVPLKKRDQFLKGFKVKPKARGENNRMFLDMPNGATLKIEVIDVLEERYRIDGKSFAYDWNTDVPLQLKTIQRRYRQDQARFDGQRSIMDLILPRANAVLPALAVACVEGACETIAAFVARTVLYLASKRGLISLAASQMTRENALAVLSRMGGANKAFWEVVKTAYLEYRTSPDAWAQALRWTREKAAAFLTKSFEHVFPNLVNTPISIATSLYMFERITKTNQKIEDGKKKGIEGEIAAKCVQDGYKADDTCPYSKLKIPSVPDTIQVPHDPWCPKNEVNEFQSYFDTDDGTIGVIARVDEQNHPISAVRYVIKNGKVDVDSIRYYHMSDAEIDSVVQPGFKGKDLPASELVTNEKRFQGQDGADKTIQDMMAQVKRRDQFMKSQQDKSKDNVIFHGNILKDHTKDALKSAMDPKAKELDNEKLVAADIMDKIKFCAEYCTLLTKHGASKSAPASTDKSTTTK